MKILAIYLVAINAAAFVVMAVDKYRAQHQQWRVREFTLMLLALLGGSLGTLLAMWACLLLDTSAAADEPLLVVLRCPRDTIDTKGADHDLYDDVA